MPNYYLCPSPHSRHDNPDGYLGWAQEFIKQGTNYLRQQPAYQYIQEGLNLVNGLDSPKTSALLSNAKTEQTLRNLKELVAAQTNIRIIPAFKTENRDFYSQQILLNKMYMGWQTSTFADRAIRKAWQYATAAGTGYLGIRWQPDYWMKGRGDIVLDAYGPLDILPVGIPKSHSIQAAYGNAIKVTTPYHEAIRTYPEYSDKIRPNRESATTLTGIVSAGVKYATAALRKFGVGSIEESDAVPWPTVDIYNIYLDDDSINDSGEVVLMGDPGTSWSYTVPYMGQPIKDGNGYRVATREDCLLYPNRRLIKMTDTVCLNPDFTRQVGEGWHAKTPIVQLRADDWAWSYLGFPITKAGASLEKANVELLRGSIDAMNVRLSPPRAYDRNTMSEALAQTMNTRIPNQVIGMDLTFSGQQMKPLLEPDYYSVPPNIAQMIAENETRIRYQMGVPDAVALARARQLPSGDSLDKIMETMGPLIKDQSRNMESSIRDMGEMWKCLAFQFYTAARRFQVYGEGGLVDEDVDYDPGNLVPAEIPGIVGGRFERARQHMGNFSFQVTPYSLHELNSITRKMFHLQLQRAGFPIDWWTMANIFDLQNFGAPPQMPDPDDPSGNTMIEADTILDRWIAQKEIESRMMMAMQGGAPNQLPTGGAGSPTTGHTPGRPPTGQTAPTMEVKSDGRPIIRESKR